MFPLLIELKDLYNRILREQAKGIVVEEQLDAMTQTVNFQFFYNLNINKLYKYVKFN